MSQKTRHFFPNPNWFRAFELTILTEFEVRTWSREIDVFFCRTVIWKFNRIENSIHFRICYVSISIAVKPFARLIFDRNQVKVKFFDAIEKLNINCEIQITIRYNEEDGLEYLCTCTCTCTYWWTAEWTVSRRLYLISFRTVVF